MLNFDNVPLTNDHHGSPDGYNDGNAALGGNGSSTNSPLPPSQDASSRAFVRQHPQRHRAPGAQILGNISQESQRGQSYSSNSHAPLPTISQEPDPSYEPFDGGSPMFSSTEHFSPSLVMEKAVAETYFDAYFGDLPEMTSLTTWIDAPDQLPPGAVRASGDTWIIEDSSTTRTALLSSAPRSALVSALTSGPLPTDSYAEIFKSLRADSSDAPSNHKEAEKIGHPWTGPDGAEAKELGNHSKNESWKKIHRSELPAGRRLHKLVWVYKMKRNGVAKARLCIQGCTMEEGIDYDQTFSQALRYSSARGLFADAARNGCYVRSVDWVAAYLQGSFIDGEVIYCYMPPGHEDPGYILKIMKPIYGAPQSGRRLQRQVFPWLRSMGLRQLDDSDGSVWVLDGAHGGEIFKVGIYVDNLQIVHSVPFSTDGSVSKPDSYLAKFMQALQRDWDVEDEGSMVDLLGMEVLVNPDGSITLHQTKFIDKMVSTFFPDGLPPHVQANSLPYSSRFCDRIIAGLAFDCVNPPFPKLVKPFQSKLGHVMYLCNSTRCDIVYAVHQLARCMCKPTPDLMLELDHLIAYLARTRTLGLTYSRESSNLCAYSDASWEERNSTSGWIVKWQSAALSWGSRKQQSVALSSCESEIIALSEATKDVVYLRRFLSGLDPSYVDGPSELFTDNQGARDTSYNPVNHDRMKHVARRHYFVRDMVEEFEIRVPYVRTSDNIADFFTKAAKNANAFRAHRRIIMNEPADSTG